MVLFQYGVALHELETERIRAGEITLADKRDILREIWTKTRRQTLKDSRGLPAAGRSIRLRVRGQHDGQPGPQRVGVLDHLLRALPEGTQEFSVEQTRSETRGSGTTGRSSARRTSPAAGCFTSCRQPLPSDRAPSVPRHPGPALRRDRPTGA